LLSVFNSVVTLVLYPYLNRNKQKFALFSKVYFSIYMFAMVPFVLAQGPIFSLFNIQEAVPVNFYYILLIGVMFTVLYSIYSTNYLLVNNQDKAVLRITLSVSLVGVVLVYPMVNMFGLNGAAASVAIPQCLLGTASFLVYKRHLRVNEGK